MPKQRFIQGTKTTEHCCICGPDGEHTYLWQCRGCKRYFCGQFHSYHALRFGYNVVCAECENE